jgi:hypothetical protein
MLTNHFEDTPREAVKAKTLAASLLLRPIFFEATFDQSLSAIASVLFGGRQRDRI